MAKGCPQPQVKKLKLLIVTLKHFVLNLNSSAIKCVIIRQDYPGLRRCGVGTGHDCRFVAFVCGDPLAGVFVLELS